MTLDTETVEEATAGIAGRLLELRRGVTAASKSTCLRFGEECADWDCFSGASAVEERRMCCSRVEEVGTDVDMLFPLEVREMLPAKAEGVSLGLPPVRPLPGIAIADAAALPGGLDLIGGLALEFLRSTAGTGGLAL